ncbi:MAG: hypothetical protein ACTHK0_16860 [Ginsengibacter sp.]
MNRKFVAPLTKKMILKLTQLCSLDASSTSGVDNFEFYLGQLYKEGILHIKKQFENGVFIFFISITETGKELLKKSELSMQTAR